MVLRDQLRVDSLGQSAELSSHHCVQLRVQVIHAAHFVPVDPVVSDGGLIRLLPAMDRGEFALDSERGRRSSRDFCFLVAPA